MNTEQDGALRVAPDSDFLCPDCGMTHHTPTAADFRSGGPRWVVPCAAEQPAWSLQDPPTEDGAPEIKDLFLHAVVARDPAAPGQVILVAWDVLTAGAVERAVQRRGAATQRRRP